MKKFVFIFFFFACFVIVGLGVIYLNTLPPGSQKTLVSFSVDKGVTAADIGTDLAKKGLIKSPLLFRMYIRLLGAANNIQVGIYNLSPSYNLLQVVDILTNRPIQIKVTIPEGFTNEQVADRFTKALEQDSNFRSQFLSLAKDREGYLFPDTYSVPKDATASLLITEMSANFDSRTKSLDIDRNKIILASIIEGETKEGVEREIVSGILYNRLLAGMALQVDVARETYTKVGLPLSPINNPGLSAIKAAINPAKTDYWYYIHDPTGTIHYARTLDEQNVNINKYLR